MRLFLAIHLLIVLGACEGPPKIVPDLYDEEPRVVNLASYHKEFQLSAFDTAQVDTSVVYVFHRNGTDLYANDSYPVSLKRLIPGDTLYVIGSSGNFNTEWNDNSYGQLLKVKTTAGLPGEVWSAHVAPFHYPQPMDFENLSDYAMECFHLTDSVEVWGDDEARVDHPSQCGLNKLIYHFEQGITLTVEQSCENYMTESLFLPSISMDQAFFIFDAFGFVEIYQTFDGSIPTPEYPDGRHTFGNSTTIGKAEFKDDGNIKSFYLERPADMAFDLMIEGNGVLMGFTAGVPCEGH